MVHRYIFIIKGVIEVDKLGKLGQLSIAHLSYKFNLYPSKKMRDIVKQKCMSKIAPTKSFSDINTSFDNEYISVNLVMIWN